jgi:hypothetical protein
VFADLSQDLASFREWLQEVDLQLRPLALDDAWSAEQIREKLAAHKVSIAFCDLFVSY